MFGKAIIATSALTLLVLPGCGSSSGQAAYLGTLGNEVDYIQWQQSSSGQLQGTVTAGQVSGTAPALTLSVNTTPFTGNIDGSSVSLTFSGLFDRRAHVVGTISGNTLILQLPAANGLIQSAGFTKGDLSAFNNVVARLRRQIRTDNARAARHRRKQLRSIGH